MAEPEVINWAKLAIDFGIAAVGALAGAYAGAMGAQFIAERGKVRDELLKELRTINVAAALAYGITDSFIGVKKQHTKPMHDTWTSERARRDEVHRRVQAGEQIVFEFDVEFRTLVPVKASVEQLRQLMFVNINLEVRPISLVNLLDRSVEQHSQIIEALNKLVLGYEQQRFNSEQLAAVYFGLRVGTRVDDRYPTTLAALAMGTDDCIFFSKLLGDELAEHGKMVAARLPKRLRGRRVMANFSRAERDSLMPNPADYPDWPPVVEGARTLGHGIWTQKFEALALVQYAVPVLAH